MFLSIVVANKDINDDQKCRQIAGHFDDHGDAVVQFGAHHPMEHISSFTRSHLMPPLGKFLRHIAPAATMVDEFIAQHKTLTKNYFC